LPGLLSPLVDLRDMLLHESPAGGLGRRAAAATLLVALGASGCSNAASRWRLV